MESLSVNAPTVDLLLFFHCVTLVVFREFLEEGGRVQIKVIIV